MALTNPTVVGPISELIGPYGIRVTGQIIGADVEVHTSTPTDSVVASGPAIASDQRFILNPGVTLSANMRLYAIQKSGGRTSAVPTGDHQMAIQRKPVSSAELGMVAFVTHLWECGQFVWIRGALPGATVELSDSSGLLLGNGPCLEGDARFALESRLRSDLQATAVQQVPGLPAGPGLSRTPDALPLPKGEALPPPIIRLPVRGCDPSLHISGVFDGALVAVRTSGGLLEEAGFDLDELTFILSAPLVAGEDILVTQRFEFCERFGTPAGPIQVGPVDPVDAPVVAKPLCAGSFMVTLSNLHGDSLVVIANNDQSWTGQTPPNVTEYTFQVSGLKAGTVTATQELCGFVSLVSDAVPVSAHEDNVPAAAINGPVFECALNVTVINIHPGATVQVFSVNDGVTSPISSQLTIYATKSAIAVSPLPRLGEEIMVIQWACSDKGVQSALEEVRPHPSPIPSVSISPPVFDGDTSVEIQGTIAGARVELHVAPPNESPRFAGAVDASYADQPAVITSTIPLTTDSILFAIQSICDVVSEPVDRVIVLSPASPRPFYIIGHNPNSIDEVHKALSAGANAIEPDVNVEADPTNPSFPKFPLSLCISHDFPPSASAPNLITFLQQLSLVADKNPQNFTLIVFDCKPLTNTPDLGYTLLMAVREHLTLSHPTLNIIISVSSFDGVHMFDRIHSILGPREAIMIDEENDPGAVANYFASIDSTAHACYGNGSIIQAPSLVPNLRPSIERACGLRAGWGVFRFIYEYTTNKSTRMREFIITGVDGIITDDPGTLVSVAANAEFAGIIRTAVRADNPFRQANSNYVLIVRTGDIGSGGTDANLTFEIVGSKGTVRRVVDASLDGRMERGDTNYVTMQTGDLGKVGQVVVQSDMTGNAPGWYLRDVEVRSWRYGVDVKGVFGGWIEDSSPRTINLA